MCVCCSLVVLCPEKQTVKLCNPACTTLPQPVGGACCKGRRPRPSAALSPVPVLPQATQLSQLRRYPRPRLPPRCAALARRPPSPPPCRRRMQTWLAGRRQTGPAGEGGEGKGRGKARPPGRPLLSSPAPNACQRLLCSSMQARLSPSRDRQAAKHPSGVRTQMGTFRKARDGGGGGGVGGPRQVTHCSHLDASTSTATHLLV